MTDPPPSQSQPSTTAPAAASSSMTLAEDTAMDTDLDPEIDLAPPPHSIDPNNNNDIITDIPPPLNGADADDDEVPEPREPTKKDISLRDFLGKMDEYAPIIPDAVTSHHLLLAGLDPHTTPLPLQRLLALATQKFIADIAADAYQYSRMRSSNTGAGAPSAAAMAGAVGAPAPDPTTSNSTSKKDDTKSSKSSAHILGVQRAGYGGGGASGGQGGRAVLTMEDLGCAVGEYGVNVKRGEFYR